MLQVKSIQVEEAANELINMLLAERDVEEEEEDDEENEDEGKFYQFLPVCFIC